MHKARCNILPRILIKHLLYHALLFCNYALNFSKFLEDFIIEASY